jgi:hypothetical protein
MTRRLLTLTSAAALSAALVLAAPAASAPAGSAPGTGDSAAAAKKKPKKCKRGKGKGKGKAAAKRKRCAKAPAPPTPPKPTPPAPAALAIAPAGYDYGLVDVFYTPRHEREFTVTNGGGLPSGALGIAFSGANPELWEVNDDGCSGAPLAAGASCTFDVAFVPVNGGTDWSATVTVTGTPGGSVSATLVADAFI